MGTIEGTKFGENEGLRPTGKKFLEKGMLVGSSEGSSEGKKLLESEGNTLGPTDGG